MITMLQKDGYEWAVEGAHWRDYGLVRLPAGNRTGLLFQDPGKLANDIDALGGYARPNKLRGRDWIAYTLPHAMDPVTGRVAFPVE
jgi:hypothetical protein